MTVDWKLSQLQRDAVSKRETLAALNAGIEGLGAMLAEAQSFEAHYTSKIEALNRRILALVAVYHPDAPYPTRLVTPEQHAEAERLRGERLAIERERDEEMARRTTTARHGPDTLTFCALRPDDVIRKRAHLVIARDQVARELAAIEEQLTPGELVQSGIPAAEYAEHRQRVAALRERIGSAS